MDILSWLHLQMSHTELLAHSFIFFINIALFFLAKPLLNLITHEDGNTTRLRIFQIVNLIILTLHLLDLALLQVNSDYQHAFIKLGMSLAAVYTALYIHTLMSYVYRRRFGLEKSVDEKKIFLDTYSSRMVSLLTLIILGFTTIYILIKIWGADSLLETTGIIGIIAAFMAFTSNIWAPDIISGLIILNTRMLEDGDVIMLDNDPNEFIISKVTLIYIVLYDVRKNHRTLIRNSKFIHNKIENLSRVASTDGLRQCLKFNIAYPELTGANADERTLQLDHFKSKIDRIFSNSFTECSENNSLKINRDKPFEWALTAAGDYALEYSLWFYLERIPNTKVTATVRKHLMGTIYKINDAVFCASEIEGVSLSTPMLNRLLGDTPRQMSPQQLS